MKNGFTLIELLVSIALLVLVTLGVAQLFPRAVSAGSRAERLTKATALAQAQIENVLALEYDLVSPGVFEAKHPISESFSRQTIVELINPATLQVSATDSGLKRVSVTVFYSTSFGERRILLSTIIAKQ